MKRYKKLAVLVGVLLTACLATFILTNRQEKKEKIKNTDEVILSVDPDTVTTLSWEYVDTSLSYHKDDSWYWDDDDAFPVDDEKIHDLLSVFEEFGAAFIIEDVEDYSQYGLDYPTCTIQIGTDSDEYKIELGDYSQMDSKRYVSIGDGNVYLVTNDPFESYNIAVSDTIKDDTIPEFEKISKIQFEGSDSYTATYKEENDVSYCADDHYFTTKNSATVPLDTDNVENYCDSISSTALGEYVSYNVTEEELADWGLDTPALKVTVTHTVTDEDKKESEETFVISIGQNQKELAEKTEAENKNEEYSQTVTSYARIGDSKIIYKLTDSKYEELIAATYNDLRHKNVLTADFDDITQIDVTLDGKSYTISSKENSDTAKDAEKRLYSFGDKELDIEELRSAIKALTIAEFSDDSPTEKEEISMTFLLDNEKFPKITVNIYRFDGTNCLVKLDGKTLGLVSRSSVVSLIETVNAIVLG